MDTIRVQGVPPLDGEYTIDILSMITLGSPTMLTNREMHDIKVKTDLRLPELADALIRGDNDVYIALADVALRRLGKRYDPAILWDATVGAITIEFADRQPEEESDDPPAQAPPELEPTSEPSRSGGASSNPTSGRQESDQSRTGGPISETVMVGQVSPLLTSVS